METTSSATKTTTQKPSKNQQQQPARRNPNKRRGKARGPPPPPLLKLVLRNFGSLDDMVVQVPPLLESVGAVVPVEQLVELVNVEKEIATTAEEWKEKQLVGGKPVETNGADDHHENKNGEGGVSGKDGKHGKMTNGAGKPKEDSLELNEASVPSGTLLVRIMYIVPPRRSRRRGSMPGSVYLILTVTGVATDENGTARTRLRLQAALDQLQQQTTSNPSSTITVEEALNAKAWKGTRRFGNETGTIFETADYKQWLESTAAATTERSNRPKPVPGGASTISTAGATNEAPVAALVTYLQNKRATERRTTNNKTRSNGNNTSNTTATTASSSSSTKKRVRSHRARRKKRKESAASAG